MNFFNQLMAEPNAITTNDLSKITSSVNAVITALFGLLTAGAVILALLLAYRFFTATDETKRKNAKNQLIYSIIGIIALVIMLIVIPRIVTWITGDILGGTATTMFSLVF